MKNILFFSLMVFATACSTSAQAVLTNTTGADESKIVIDATGMSTAAADRITFQINLSRFHENAQTAFNRHKELERYLTDLLLDKGIEDERIQANPISISPRRYSEGQGYETRQRVTVELDDIGEFEQMQVDLIENGFDNFSGAFGSSEQEEAVEEAIANAVETAQRKARILAQAAGKQLGGVIGIEHTSTRGPIYRESGALAMSATADDGGMLQFQTTIPVRENVRVIFRLAN
ncbi:SIMPL domain-containing protein [Rhodohalobacter mucosus]|uniref:Secreted protein n=1 Tax=Rhodohalobacter mucosus TaxID=2079485 RepID=A0A316TTC4_9BACT|nr:SIMPL domain-containing protein [Rhodohalobacter mucosus]PWN06871.1 hypothetical protein DDZ15_06240 [Rhodohalobacter mucosus]